MSAKKKERKEGKGDCPPGLEDLSRQHHPEAYVLQVLQLTFIHILSAESWLLFLGEKMRKSGRLYGIVDRFDK